MMANVKSMLVTAVCLVAALAVVLAATILADGVSWPGAQQKGAIAGIEPSPFLPHEHVGLLGCQLGRGRDRAPVVVFLQLGSDVRNPDVRVDEPCAEAIVKLSTAELKTGALTSLRNILVWELVTITNGVFFE